MKYRLTQSRAALYLETIDADGDSSALKIKGNDVSPVEEPELGGVLLDAGGGDFEYFGSVSEFRTPTWKIRSDGESWTARTGDGTNVEHIFSGNGVGRTGETVEARLRSFFARA